MWHVLTTHQPAARRANLMIVVDISGSMADLAPGSQTPLIALVRDGVARGQLAAARHLAAGTVAVRRRAGSAT